MEKSGKDCFWDAVENDDDEAKALLLDALRKNSKGNVEKSVNSYLSHIRRFRRFLLGDNDKTELPKRTEKKKTQKKALRYNVNIPTPTEQQVEHYLKKWDALENYSLQEKALDKLFNDLCPKNTEIEDVLLKVSTLNEFYSTNIFYVYFVATHILSLKIDERLKAGDLTLVNDIAQNTINGMKRKLYSFASKYCSHHNSQDYPIYDYYVDKVLRYFRNRDAFSNFADRDLKKYVCFKRAMIDFRAFYGLGAYNLKQIDRYIWQLGKEYFPRSYKKSTKK